jgi:endonuclease YncB( thermonuclease family)
MLLSGVMLGLLAFQAVPFLPPAQGEATETVSSAEPAGALMPVDPYAESRRSRALLQRQEGAPPAVAASWVRRARGAIASPDFVRVVDGDTFVYAGTRIRIADIDTPEVHGRCPYETELAARATARMRQLLAAGAFELQPLASGRDEDRYGRKLRIVTRGGRSLGDVLVAEGLARTWTGRRELWC